MTDREKLAHALKIKFGLPPDRPNDVELDAILQDIRAITKPTEAEWETIVRRHVKYAGKYIYEGLDYSNLNYLLALIPSPKK